MDASRIDLLALAERRLAWLGQRQEVLSQNVANADTPGWRARDLASFASTLSRAGVAPVQTHPSHLAGAPDVAAGGKVLRTSPRAPDGNGVSVEQELMKVAETETSQELATNVYSKYLGLFRLALGRAS